MAARARADEPGIWFSILADMVVFSVFFGVFLVARMKDPALFAAARTELSTTLGMITPWCSSRGRCWWLGAWPRMSERRQIAVGWWALVMTAIYGLVLGFLLRRTPPPKPSHGAEAMAAFYRDNSTSIRVGAMICSWVAVFMLAAFATRRSRGGSAI